MTYTVCCKGITRDGREGPCAREEGITLIPIGIYTDFPGLPEVLALGFDFVELPLNAMAALNEADFQEFAEYADARRIPIAVCSHMLPTDLAITGEKVSAQALHGYLQHAFRRAHRLGVKCVVMDAPKSRSVPADVDYPFAWRQLGNFLRLAQGHAASCGIDIAIEPIRKGDCNLLNLVSEATLIAGLLQLDRIGVAAHSGHMAMASEPMSTLRRAAPLLRHVHAQNALTRQLPREGDGEDYRQLMRTLNSIGYAGGVCVCGEADGDFVTAAQAALYCLRKSDGRE